MVPSHDGRFIPAVVWGLRWCCWLEGLYVTLQGGWLPQGEYPKRPGGRCMLLCLVVQSYPTLWDPKDCSLPGSSVHGDSPGKNTGVGFHALLQGILPTQGANLVSRIAGRFFTIWATREAHIWPHKSCNIMANHILVVTSESYASKYSRSRELGYSSWWGLITEAMVQSSLENTVWHNKHLNFEPSLWWMNEWME